MDPALVIEITALADQKPINDAISRGDSPVQQFYSGATVFVTGGSGFLGKQLVEKLFRSCKIKKMFILLRSKKGKTIKERMTEITSDPIFASLHFNKSDFIERLIPVEGDVAELGLGMDHKMKQQIVEEIEVIFHVAATIGFEEPLRSATLTNVRGTREMIRLAKLCKRLKSFVHVSTAYSHATTTRPGSRILEQFYPCPLTPELMIEMAEAIDTERLNNMKQSLIYDWPNTYTFTKALAEELIRTNAGDLPICILRPTVVICTRRGPCPGWVDRSSVFGPSGMALGTTMGVIHVMHARQDIKIDFVPVDYVCNAAIAAAVRAGDQPLKIYQIGSSNRNYITWGEVTNFLGNEAVKKVISDRAMWCSFVIQTPYRPIYLVLKYLLHDVPALVVDKACAVLKKPQRLKKMYSRVNKMLQVLTPYSNNDWIFDDSNTLDLYQNLSDADKCIYNLDVADIKWKNMIVLWYVGLRKYIVKDGLINTKTGLKRQFYYQIITCCIIVLFLYVFYLLFCFCFD